MYSLRAHNILQSRHSSLACTADPHSISREINYAVLTRESILSIVLRQRPLTKTFYDSKVVLIAHAPTWTNYYSTPIWAKTWEWIHTTSNFNLKGLMLQQSGSWLPYQQGNLRWPVHCNGITAWSRCRRTCTARLPGSIPAASGRREGCQWPCGWDCTGCTGRTCLGTLEVQIPPAICARIWTHPCRSLAWHSCSASSPSSMVGGLYPATHVAHVGKGQPYYEVIRHEDRSTYFLT